LQQFYREEFTNFYKANRQNNFRKYYLNNSSGENDVGKAMFSYAGLQAF